MTQPRHGDIAYYESCVPGGHPYLVVVIWRHRDPNGQGWYNICGTEFPIDPDYLATKTLRPICNASLLPYVRLVDPPEAPAVSGFTTSPKN